MSIRGINKELIERLDDLKELGGIKNSAEINNIVDKITISEGNTAHKETYRGGSITYINIRKGNSTEELSDIFKYLD